MYVLLCTLLLYLTPMCLIPMYIIPKYLTLMLHTLYIHTNDTSTNTTDIYDPETYCRECIVNNYFISSCKDRKRLSIIIKEPLQMFAYSQVCACVRVCVCVSLCCTYAHDIQPIGYHRPLTAKLIYLINCMTCTASVNSPHHSAIITEAVCSTAISISGLVPHLYPTGHIDPHTTREGLTREAAISENCSGKISTQSPQKDHPS